MKEKEKKGFFSRLLFAEPKTGCCNVQFEEIPDNNDNLENTSNKKIEGKEENTDNTTKTERIMILEIFDPSMCCESGVCGPEPDKALIDLQNTIQLLKKAGVETKRYAINQSRPWLLCKTAWSAVLCKNQRPG
ncbi:MAG: arsenic metallochaperone ArsD family protein [Bacteroidales bacterium]|nr:arsenic metallochaperone ArsD family protein [Bacteroidales bacterium]